MLSDNAMSVLDVYIIMIDNAQNFSDQVAIKCILDYDVYHYTIMKDPLLMCRFAIIDRRGTMPLILTYAIINLS